MMRANRKIIRLLTGFVLLVSMLTSCTTPQKVAYFQDTEQLQGAVSLSRQMLRLRPEDKINVIVHSADPMLAAQFTLTANSRSVGAVVTPEIVSGNSAGGGAGQIVAYTVDDQGDIEFPVLGKVSVIGRTRREVAEYIEKRLRDRGLVKDAIVTVEYVNLGINVLGEVAHPGHIDIKKDHFTLLDALAAAGDMTINGDREHVKVLRTIDGQEYTYEINLCKKYDLIYSDAYYLQQNDVVYVVPTAKRQREANTNGNVFKTPTFWMSVASFLMTLITFLSK